MKKILIAATVFCAAIAANAATIKWGSGAVQTPGEGGALSGTKLTSSSGYTLKMYAWESLTAANVAYSAGDLYSWYDKGASSTKDPFGGSVAAIAGDVNMGASATTAFATGTVSPATDGTTVYAAILFVLEDSTTGDAQWYMENSGAKASGKAVQTLANLSLKQGGTGSATAWTAVPEPTSGLLMLLGMAGLALRRRRA